MKAFGLELRKVGSVAALYKEVDMALGKLPPGGVDHTTQVMTVAHALQKMISSQNYFDVCTIDRCAEVCQICISIERRRIYSAIHCVYWNEMLPEYRQKIVAMVLDDFRGVLNPGNV